MIESKTHKIRIAKIYGKGLKTRCKKWQNFSVECHCRNDENAIGILKLRIADKIADYKHYELNDHFQVFDSEKLLTLGYPDIITSPIFLSEKDNVTSYETTILFK